MHFETLNSETYMRIMRPKVHGMWNLHSCLSSHSLDFFVNLASASGTWGGRGQAVYAATSTALGAFAQWRTAQNMPTVTIHIALVSEVGYVAERKELRESLLKDIATVPISEREMLALVMTAIEGRSSGPELYAGFSPSGAPTQAVWLSDAKFSHIRLSFMRDAQDERMVASPATVSLSMLLKRAESVAVVKQLIVGGLTEKLCSLLMLQEEDIDASRPLRDQGLDSLVMVELRNWISKETEVGIGLVEIMEASTLGALAEVMGQKSRLVDWKKLEEAA